MFSSFMAMAGQTIMQMEMIRQKARRDKERIRIEWRESMKLSRKKKKKKRKELLLDWKIACFAEEIL